MADVLKDNVMLIKEYRKFESETARMSKDAWKKRVTESLYEGFVTIYFCLINLKR